MTVVFTIGKNSKKAVSLYDYSLFMLGPSGFFLPDNPGATHTDSNSLELIHSSEAGFSQLYRGSKNGRFFVYKALKKEYRGNPLYEELLKKDFNIGFSLNHTGICQYFGLIDFPSIGNCIVMEWIDGQNLESLINQGVIDKPLARKIICETCDALEYIHRKQIIHRDLKPENIMITNNGRNVKIIDFGLSDADSYCTFKAPAGTKAYASPELIAGEKLDARSDIWALGVIINELSGSFTHVTSRCLRRDKEQRYTSAADVKRAILQEGARKMRNIAAIAAVLVSIAGAVWIFGGNQETVMPEPMTGITEITDTTEAVAPAEPGPAERVPAERVPAAMEPAPIPSEIASPAIKKTTPKDSSTHNSEESLDADALDDMFKNAAELIL